MRKTIILTTLLLMVTSVLAQKTQKPWQEWNKKEAEKILADSPWSQTQTETDTSEMFFSPTTMGDTHSRESQGATNQATSLKYYIRLFSARPVRQAYVRLLELSQGNADEAATEKRRAWANLAASDSIIVTVACESSDRRYLGRAMQAFSSAVTAMLKNSAYLERQDGVKVFLAEYVPPGKDVFGARFIFPRDVNGEPLVTNKGGSLRFHAEYESKTATDQANNPPGQTSRRGAVSQGGSSAPSPFKFKVDMKFKLSDMLYNGEVEY
ncbi:MAG TPA: hypothetical protein VN643_13245 [Pyrinomonadaceae bacterium]|nr:hypothetical protein [Pyrinomonadaceae bacterium]